METLEEEQVGEAIEFETRGEIEDEDEGVGVIALPEAAQYGEADTKEKSQHMHHHHKKKNTNDPPATQFEPQKSIKATTSTQNPIFHLPPEDPTQPPPARQLMNQAKTVSTMNLNKHGIIAQATEEEEEEEERVISSSTNEDGLPSSPDSDDGMAGYRGAIDSVRTGTDISYLTPLPPRENIIDIDVLKDQVFFVFPDWQRRLSKFSILIVLASIIATCGILADSTATVIGAMIVVGLRTSSKPSP